MPSATKSAIWNRGAYLVEGLGHGTSACHSPRNDALAREQKKAYLAVGLRKAVEAPPLTIAGRKHPFPGSRMNCSLDLRSGEIPNPDGVAAGLMAPVVKELARPARTKISARWPVYLGSSQRNRDQPTGPASTSPPKLEALTGTAGCFGFFPRRASLG